MQPDWPRWLDASELRRSLPAETDALVVGGGIAGASVAYYLARAGVEVVLVERSELNREASGTNAGSMHLQIAIHQLDALDTGTVSDRLLADVRLGVAAAQVWHGLEAELDGSVELHVTGGLTVAETASELRLLHDKQAIEEEAGLETVVLEGDELFRHAPYLARDLVGATFCPLEGHVNPLLAVPLLALRAHEHGAQLRTQTEVTAISAEGRDGGGPFRVMTSAGPIRAQRIVNAAGAWASEVGELVGLRLPLWSSGLHVNVTEPRARLIQPLIQHIGRRLTLKQSASGTFIIGGGWPARPEHPPLRYSTTWESAAGNAAVAVRVVPALADVRVVRTWSGVMAFTDDLAPVAGTSARVPGFSTCVAAAGFTLSPILARMLAEELTSNGADSPLPPEYSPDRALARPAPTT